MVVHIETFGELAISHNGKAVKLPASKRTRALLAYLAVTRRPHRRDRLCEVFWEAPDDPRGSLRWSLSKLRPLMNTEDNLRLQADRERVALDGVAVDVHELTQMLEQKLLSAERLRQLAEQLQRPFLEGLELPDQDIFQRWLTAERCARERQLGMVCARLAHHSDCLLDEQLQWARQWFELEPLNPHAATMLATQLDRSGELLELVHTVRECNAHFRKAGIAWSEDDRVPLAELLSANQLLDTGDHMLAKQQVQFCQAEDGVRIAYASVGEGPCIVKAANWLTHLEHDWDAPIWSPLFRDLAKDHHFVRYDERGNGLSDWEVKDLSFSAFVTDLESVVEASGLDRFTLLGISQGAAVSIEYAIRHPERVKHLILFGGYAAGWRIGASEAVTREREAVATLTATGWGQDNPAYRQIFSTTFMPDANAEELAWFNEFQRLTTSPENAVRFLSVFSGIDVREQLAQLRVPTLVIHALGDQRISVSVGRAIADAIPNAEFVGLDSSNHLLLGREPASKAFTQAVRDFIARN